MPLLTKEQMYTPQNIARSTSLVYETAKQTDNPVFTLSFVRDDFIRLGELFIELTIEDPTETVFAEHVFGSQSFWLNMREANRLKPSIEEWREMADAKRKQLAFQSLVSEVKTNGKSSVTAAKYLIEEPWKPKTKEQKEKTLRTTEKAYTTIREDAERLKDLLQ